MTVQAHVTARIYPASKWPVLADVWAELASASPYSSFFTSREWTAAWLSIFTDVLSVNIIVFYDAEQAVGICLLTRRTEKRGLTAVKRVYLNTGGEDEDDEACIEFNNILCRAGYETSVTNALADCIDNERWDEIVAPGMCPGPVLNALENVLSRTRIYKSPSASAYVDLQAVRVAHGGEYESSLGSRTRKNYRQSLRKYTAEYGEAALDCAGTKDEALAMLEELADLHQRSWVARGKPGVFASTRFSAFHRMLVETAWQQDKVRLFRFRAGDNIIGLIYTFVDKNRVYFYQSGLQYSDNPRLQPGLVTLVQLIQHCTAAGYDEFSFLAGDAQYKQLLSTGVHDLIWVVFQRANLKMQTMEFLSRSRRSLRSYTQASV
jgi:hypothetical protein